MALVAVVGTRTLLRQEQRVKDLLGVTGIRRSSPVVAVVEPVVRLLLNRTLTVLTVAPAYQTQLRVLQHFTQAAAGVGLGMPPLVTLAGLVAAALAVTVAITVKQDRMLRATALVAVVQVVVVRLERILAGTALAGL